MKREALDVPRVIIHIFEIVARGADIYGALSIPLLTTLYFTFL